jgi:hypothetical protein
MSFDLQQGDRMPAAKDQRAAGVPPAILDDVTCRHRQAVAGLAQARAGEIVAEFRPPA